MTLKTVLINPNPSLREKSRNVSVDEIHNPKFQQLIDDLIETMVIENGVGLAAPQIGVHQRLIIVETKDGPKAFINPEIVKSSLRMVSGEEGCLSIPGIFGLVKRHKHIKLKALDRRGNLLEMKVGGFDSVIFQHEIDHLDGILFIDKAYKMITKEEKDRLREESRL